MPVFRTDCNNLYMNLIWLRVGIPFGNRVYEFWVGNEGVASWIGFDFVISENDVSICLGIYFVYIRIDMRSPV